MKKEKNINLHISALKTIYYDVQLALTRRVYSLWFPGRQRSKERFYSCVTRLLCGTLKVVMSTSLNMVFPKIMGCSQKHCKREVGKTFVLSQKCILYNEVLKVIRFERT